MAWGSDHCGFTTSSLQLHQEHPVKYQNPRVKTRENELQSCVPGQKRLMSISAPRCWKRQLLKHWLRGLPSAQPLVGFGTCGFVFGFRDGQGQVRFEAAIVRTKWFWSGFSEVFAQHLCCEVSYSMNMVTAWLQHVTAPERVWHQW